MKNETMRNAFLIVCFLLVGMLSWLIQYRAKLESDLDPLSTLPTTLGDWRSEDIPLEGNVERMLRADFNLQRVYANSVGDVIWLYVGYYGTERGGRPEHTPRVCYNAHGWNITDSHVVRIDRERKLYAREFIVARGGQRRLVHHWFASSRSLGLTGTRALSFDHLINRIRTGRADGGLVRVSTPLRTKDGAEERLRLASFDLILLDELGDHWPREYRAGKHPRMGKPRISSMHNRRGVSTVVKSVLAPLRRAPASWLATM